MANSTTAVTTTDYTQCECDFWNAAHDRHCANCGVSLVKEYEAICKPLSPKKKMDYESYCGCIGAIIGVGIGAIIGVSIGSVVGGLITSGISVFIGGFIGERIAKDKALTKRITIQVLKTVPGLRSNKATIKQHLQEIVKQKQTMIELIQELSEQDDASLNRVRLQAIKKALTELERKGERYAGKLREIELIRWSNQLSPLISRYTQIAYAEVNQRLQRLDNAQQQGRHLLQTWTQTLLTGEDGQRCVERLQQALSGCDQLRQDLLDMKTAAAIQGVSAFDQEQPAAPHPGLDALDVFNALPDVGLFTEGFKKLEEEYFRLQGEDEVNQLLQR